MPDLSVSPASAAIGAHEACRFSVNSEDPASWAISPTVGSITSEGVYTSPWMVLRGQKVIVTAKVGSNHATASVEVTDSATWVHVLAWYAIIVGLVLGVGITGLWRNLHHPAVQMVVVNPRMVTLNPTTGESFAFTATAVGDEKNSVQWSVTGGDAAIDDKGTLLLKATAAPFKDLTITATSKLDPARSGTAFVHLATDAHFEISPQSASACTAEQVFFHTSAAKTAWGVSRADVAAITQTGVFTPGGRGKKPLLVQVNAWGDKPGQQAAVSVILTPPPSISAVSDPRLLIFVILCGALGSMLHSVASFVNYVGNQSFCPSWFWFYISRPFVGGALALVFFFALGSGLVTGATIADPMKIALVSALVGLFSDKAIKKLSDVFDVLMATKDDDRKDKLTGDPKPPKIDASDLATIPANTATPVKFTGSNLKDAKVTVNGLAAAPTDATEKGFSLNITAAAPTATIIATTGEGSTTFALAVK